VVRKPAHAVSIVLKVHKRPSVGNASRELSRKDGLSDRLSDTTVIGIVVADSRTEGKIRLTSSYITLFCPGYRSYST